MLAGGDVTLNADAQVLANDSTISILYIVTSTRDIEYIAGYNYVNMGTVTVDKVTWVTTQLTEQVGTKEVPTGNYFFTMDVTLEQIGYYNKNAVDGEKFKEVFIEGIDYLNSEVAWAKAGNEATPNRTAESVTSNYKDSAYKGFTQLNDAQKQAVLNHLGYKPLFDFSYSDYTKNQVINGTPSAITEGDTYTDADNNVVTYTGPTWKNNADVVYSLDLAGLKDKFILMPEGANQDLLRAVSQGEAEYQKHDDTNTDLYGTR